MFDLGGSHYMVFFDFCDRDRDRVFFNLGNWWLAAKKCLLLFLFFEWVCGLDYFRWSFSSFRDH